MGADSTAIKKRRKEIQWTYSGFLLAGNIFTKKGCLKKYLKKNIFKKVSFEKNYL